MSSVDDFVATPSLELLGAFSKQQLWEVVAKYDIMGLNKRMHKDDLLQSLKQHLVEKKILSPTALLITKSSLVV